MLRKTLTAAALLIASTSALANDGYVYGRVITVEPSFSISFGGGRHNDGYRVLYETGGEHYWTHSHIRPREVIYVPRPVYVQPVNYSSYSHGDDWRHHGGHGRKDHRSGWRDHDREDNDHDRKRGHSRGHDGD